MLSIFSRIPITMYVIGGLIGLLLFTFYLYHKEVEESGRLKETITSLQSGIQERDDVINNLQATRLALELTYSKAQDESKQIQSEFESLKTKLNAPVRVDRSKANEATQILTERQYIDATSRVLTEAYNLHSNGGNKPSESSSSAMQGNTSGSTKQSR